MILDDSLEEGMLPCQYCTETREWCNEEYCWFAEQRLINELEREQHELL